MAMTATAATAINNDNNNGHRRRRFRRPRRMCQRSWRRRWHHHHQQQQQQQQQWRIDGNCGRQFACQWWILVVLTVSWSMMMTLLLPSQGGNWSSSSSPWSFSSWSFTGTVNAEPVPPPALPPTGAALYFNSAGQQQQHQQQRHKRKPLHSENKEGLSPTGTNSNGNDNGVVDKETRQRSLRQHEYHYHYYQQQPQRHRELPRTDDEYRSEIDTIANDSPYDCSHFVDWGDVPIDCHPTEDPNGAANGGGGAGGASDDVVVVVGDDDDDIILDGGVAGGDDNEEDTVADTDDDDENDANDASPTSFSPAASPHYNVSPATAWQDDDDHNDDNDYAGNVNSPVASPTTTLPSTDEDGNDDNDVPPPTIRNAVRLAVSMGVVHLGHLSVDDSHTLVEMCLRAMTITLNSYDYNNSTGQDSGSANNNNDTDINGNITGPFLVSDHGLDLTIQHQDKESGYNDTEPIDDGSNAAASTTNNGTQSPVVAHLYLHEVHVRESDNVDEWFIVYATYAVTWPSRRPILSPRALKEIEERCHKILDHSMMAGRQFSHRHHLVRRRRRRRRRRRELQGDPELSVEHEHGNNDFWNTLTSLPFGQGLLLEPPPWPYDVAGLADCVDVGAEYNFSHYMEPSQWDDDGGILPPSPPDDMGFNALNETYTMALKTSWQAREWTGLALLLGTLVASSILSFTADRLHRQREREDAWGAVLTEEGVGEILQVGWRYQQSGPTPPQATEPRPGGGGGADIDGEELETEAIQQQQQQLFLQLYDKAKLGYNDDNSLLLGGVERQIFFDNGGVLNRPPTTNTTETATTVTPPPAPATRNVQEQ